MGCLGRPRRQAQCRTTAQLRQALFSGVWRKSTNGDAENAGGCSPPWRCQTTTAATISGLFSPCGQCLLAALRIRLEGEAHGCSCHRRLRISAGGTTAECGQCSRDHPWDVMRGTGSGTIARTLEPNCSWPSAGMAPREAASALCIGAAFRHGHRPIQSVRVPAAGGVPVRLLL